MSDTFKDRLDALVREATVNWLVKGDSRNTAILLALEAAQSLHARRYTLARLDLRDAAKSAARIPGRRH